MAVGGITYASGKNSLAICPRCSLQYPYHQLRKDGQNKDWVCVDCWDPKHPQEILPRDIYDATALRHPRVESDKCNDSYRLETNACCMTGFVGLFSVVIT